VSARSGGTAQLTYGHAAGEQVCGCDMGGGGGGGSDGSGGGDKGGRAPCEHACKGATRVAYDTGCMEDSCPRPQ
jgi:hypothetical protein